MQHVEIVSPYPDWIKIQQIRNAVKARAKARRNVGTWAGKLGVSGAIDETKLDLCGACSSSSSATTQAIKSSSTRWLG
jgi:hypothetical protein